MSEEKKRKIQEAVTLFKQMDETDLRIIMTSMEVLKARQDLDKKTA